MSREEQSTRSKLVVQRTYARPLNEEETKFESWTDICKRVVYKHQRWLWERQLGRDLNQSEYEELDEFYKLMVERKVSTSGRTLWLGGTEVSKRRESSQFNCSFTNVETVYDIVDVLWLLMQGCGVGFRPVVGTLTGFMHKIEEVQVIRTKRTEKGGLEHNVETYEDGVWTIKVGDSAESWAKAMGKLFAGKKPARKLVFDLSELRPAGSRLKGYGWISSGDGALSKALLSIANILNNRADDRLTRMDILDCVNWLGTILSSRRSAQIALFEYDKPEWREFATAKKDFWTCNNCGSHETSKGYCTTCGMNEDETKPWYTNSQRVQSNNSILWEKVPTKEELTEIFDMMIEAGGSEPGFVNALEARRRAPWFYGSNPCCEILLGNKTFCNLVEIDIAKFPKTKKGHDEMLRALYISARANYRQTCVDLRDGVLQEAWHLQNEHLRLNGVGITGIAQRDDLNEVDLEFMRGAAHLGSNSMASELGTQRSKNITTVKPSGTLSKVMDTTEGVHKPLAKYLFNNIVFGVNDPMIPLLKDANYEVLPHPLQPDESYIVKFPVAWENVEFDKITMSNGVEVDANVESAITQLERYKKWQVHYCDQNVSNTISYSADEKDEIVDWLLNNWDCYVGVSFLFRSDPSKTAADLGYLYLPQQPVTKEEHDDYVSTLKEIDLSGMIDSTENEMESQECAGGACPTK